MAGITIAEWLRSRVRGRALSANQQRIVNALERDPQKFLLVSVKEFAAFSGVSPATVSRCVSSLGYGSYGEFQQEMKARLFQPQKLTSVYNYLDAGNPAGAGARRQMLEAEETTLRGLFAGIDDAVFSGAAAAVAGAERVHIMGYGSSTALLRFLQYRLMRIGLDVVDMTSVSELNMVAEHCVHMDAKRDVIVTVSFRGVYENILHLLRFASAFGIPSIAFSENQESEISRLSGFRIPIKRAVINEFKSLAAPMSVMNLFVMETAGFLEPRKASIARRLAWFRKYQDTNKPA